MCQQGESYSDYMHLLAYRTHTYKNTFRTHLGRFMSNCLQHIQHYLPFLFSMGLHDGNTDRYFQDSSCVSRLLYFVCGTWGPSSEGLCIK